MNSDRRFPYPVRVLLACGCTIPARLHPLTESMKFACSNGAGHGYSLPWIRSMEGGRVNVNRRYEGQEKEGAPVSDTLS